MRDFAERDRSPVFLSSVHQSFIHALAEQPARRGCTSSLSFHPHCCFRPPANPFLSAPPSCGCVFSLGHMCDRNPPNGKKGRRKYVISCTHPPKTAVVLKEVHKERVFSMRVMRVRACLRVCASRAGVKVCVPAGKRGSLARKSMSGSRGWTIMQKHLFWSFLPQAARLWWLVTPAGTVNPQFPLHNLSGQARAKELHNVKLSETSYKASFGLVRRRCKRTDKPRDFGPAVPLLGTPDLLHPTWWQTRNHSNCFNGSAHHHAGNRSKTQFIAGR